MRPARHHRVTVTVDGREIDGWIEYTIDTSMLEPADSFSLSMPFDRQAYDLCAPDRAVRVNVDRVTLITGYIDKRVKSSSRDGSLLTVTGRDKVGRLVQESTGAVTFSGMTMSSLFERLARPWFRRVVLSNTRNRRLLRGKGVKVRATDKVFIDSVFGSRLEPGSSKYQVMHDICEQAGCLIWSSGDGRELVIGTPNYEQDVQFQFRNTEDKSPERCNVISMALEDDVGDRYARITVIGSGRGDEGTYGMAPASRHGEYRDGPAADGTGRDFKYAKDLIVADRYGIKSKADATLRAQREAARRDMRRHVVPIEAPTHGQLLPGGTEPTLFAPDLLAFAVDEETGRSGAYLVVSCSYRCSRGGGEMTSLELLPKGTEITV